MDDTYSQDSRKRRRFANIQDAAETVREVRKTLPVTVPSLGIINTPTKRGRPKKVAAAPIGLATYTDDSVMDKRIEQAKELATATKELQEHYIQKNLAESSVAADIVSQNAPVTSAIQDLQDKLNNIAKEQQQDRVTRRSTKDAVRAAQQQALIDSIASIKGEITTSSGVTKSMRDDLIQQLTNLEGKLNTGNTLTAEVLNKIEASIEAIEAKASQSSSAPKSNPLEDNLAALAKNFGVIDSIIDDPNNKFLKEQFGEGLYGALRQAVSNYHSGKLNDLDYKALRDAMPKFNKIAELSPSIKDLLDGVIDVSVKPEDKPENKEEEEVEVEDNLQADARLSEDNLLSGKYKSIDTMVYMKKDKQRLFNGTPVKYNEWDLNVKPTGPSISIGGKVYKATKGLALLLTVSEIAEAPLAEDLKTKYITRSDIKDYLSIYRDTRKEEDKDTKKYQLILHADTILAESEANKGEKPYSATSKEKPVTAQGIKDRGPYHIDAKAYESGRVKLFGPPKTNRAGNPVRPKALIDIPLSDDLDLLLSNKKISPTTPLDPVAIEHFKTIYSYIGDTMKIGKQGTRYALLHGTKMPKDKSKIIKTPKDPVKIREKLNENIGLINAGNTSEQLKLQSLTMMKQLKDAGSIDRSFIDATLPLLN